MIGYLHLWSRYYFLISKLTTLTGRRRTRFALNQSAWFLAYFMTCPRLQHASQLRATFTDKNQTTECQAYRVAQKSESTKPDHNWIIVNTFETAEPICVIFGIFQESFVVLSISVDAVVNIQWRHPAINIAQPHNSIKCGQATQQKTNTSCINLIIN